MLDHIDPFSAGGAKIWEISDDTVELRLDTLVRSTIPVGKPNDIAVDAEGRLYLLDIATAQILLLEGDELSIWWQSPDESYQIAGLAYNPASDSLLMSDVARNAVYEIPLNAADAEQARETVFINEELETFPAFNGLTVAEDGTIYIAAFDINEIWQIIPGTNEHTVLTGNYRGSSDVAYDSANKRLYVNNWDQSWLIPITLVIMQVDVPPRLPFSVDVIEFTP